MRHNREAPIDVHNASVSDAVCDGRLHDKMRGTSAHANGQRIQRPSALNSYAEDVCYFARISQYTAILTGRGSSIPVDLSIGIPVMVSVSCRYTDFL